MTTEFDDLIARLEAATQSSQALDCEIALACGWRRHDPKNSSPYTWINLRGAYEFGPPPFSASLDAAVTLVPEGYGWQVGRPIQNYGATGCYSSVFRERRKDEVGFWPGAWGHDGDHSKPPSSDWKTRRYAANGAIALCLAALRARAELTPATGEEDGGNARQQTEPVPKDAQRTPNFEGQRD